MTSKRELGSQTAKNGFKNEDFVVDTFNNWEISTLAQRWLEEMDYKIREIKKVKAVKLSGYKTDVQVQVKIFFKEAIDSENLQIKLLSNKNGFNQIDKRCVDKYSELWNIPNDIIKLLKFYTGELLPTFVTRDQRRVFANEFSDLEQKKLIKWIKDNQQLIVSDIMRGRGKFAAEWILVIKRIADDIDWRLKSINYCMNFFGNGNVEITDKGNIRIANITMQRKGGDGGKDTAKMLQFKINPALIFEYEQ